MRYVCLLFAAALAAAPLTVRADDAGALLAEHKAFAGWQLGDGSLPDLSLDGTMTHQKDGAEVKYATVHALRKGVASRTVIDREDGMGTDSGFTGRVFWQANQNGFVHPVVGDAEKAAIAADMLFNEGAVELSGTLRGTDTVDGVTCDVVRVKADVSDNLDVCVDPRTGAYKRAVIDPGGTYEQTIDILAYSEAAPGKKIISKWRYKGSEYTHQWTKIQRAVISDADLHPPAQTATWSFNGQPFGIDFKDNDTDRHVILTASFNGVQGRFLMDTGAGAIFLNKKFADRAHLKSLDIKSSAYGIGGSTTTHTLKADTMKLGGNTLSNVVVYSQDSDFGDVDGLIGYDLFGGAIVMLNLDSQQMTLFDPAQMQAQDGGGIPVLVDLSSETPTIPMTVNGNIPINATLDSGDLAEVTVSHDLVSKYGLKMLVDTSIQGITSAIRFTRGVGGVEREECGRLDSISVGPVVYQNAPACKSRSFSGNDALVGFDFIKNFNIIFDYPHGKMILLPRAQSN